MKNKILVTGSTGFVGTWCLERLDTTKFSPLYTYREQATSSIKGKALRLDLTNPNEFLKYKQDFEDITHVLHLATLVPDKNKPLKSYEDNFHANITRNIQMFENLTRNLPNLRHFVFLSSCYANNEDVGIGFYGTGKQIMELAIHRAGVLRSFSTIALRFPQIYGPGETHGMFVNEFIKNVLAHKTISLDANARSAKDLVYVDDVAMAINYALGLEGHETVTISSDDSYSVVEVAEEIVRLCNKNKKSISYPATFNNPKPPLHFPSNYRSLGFPMIKDLREGLIETIKFYKGKENV